VMKTEEDVVVLKGKALSVGSEAAGAELQWSEARRHSMCRCEMVTTERRFPLKNQLTVKISLLK